MPEQYMFKDIPGEIGEGVDAVAVTLDNMDRYGIDKGLINVGSTVREEPRRAIRSHPDRFLGSSTSTPARAWTRCARSASSTTSTASSRCRASRRAA